MRVTLDRERSPLQGGEPRVNAFKSGQRTGHRTTQSAQSALGGADPDLHHDQSQSLAPRQTDQ